MANSDYKYAAILKTTTDFARTKVVVYVHVFAFTLFSFILYILVLCKIG